ncbi:MAG: peptidoglycan D,D-transpeptidase FtsI family protein [bacterium]
MERRSVILATIVVFCFGVLFYRLFDIMLLHHGKFAHRATAQHTQELDVQKRRGIIYDRKGKELAVNMEQRSLYCDPLKVGSIPATVNRLSRLTDTDREDLTRKLNGGKRFVWIKRKIDPGQALRIERMNIEGVGFIPEPDRVYPRGKLASHLIGFVDIDNNGLSGVEKSYEKALTTEGGKVVVATDARGNILLAGNELESIGSSLVLTVDEVLQYIVEKALDTALLKWRPKAATVIMMNPHTGEILAMANRPTFNPNTPGKYPEPNRRNAAVTDIYEPGSTFKIVSAAAVLEEKLFSPRSTFDCSKGYIEVGNKRIKDDHRHGVLTLTEVIQKSSNVGAVQMAQKLGKERLFQYARRFGFGQKSGVDLPGETAGWIREPAQWSGTSIGAVAIGQEVAVTPLQVLRAYAAVANGGNLVTPSVVSRTISPSGEILYERQAQDTQRIISPHTAALLREMLETVTLEGGTALDASIEGNTIAGKTGTAQVFDNVKKKYSREKYVSSFVGFFPSEKPRIAMIVTVSEPVGEIFGGKVAAPIFREIADKALAYLNVPMDRGPYQNVIHVRSTNEARPYY